jgi:MSHA type pilus biogenesis protein MshL
MIRSAWSVVPMVAVAMAVLAGCASTSAGTPPPARPPAERNAAETLAAMRQASPSGEPPAPVLLESVEAEKKDRGELKKKEGRFFLALRDADLRESLIALARDMEASLVLEPDVTGKVTVDLKNVTLEEALNDLVRPIYDYSYDGRTIRVFKPARMTQTFKVDYIATSRNGASTVTATATGGGSSSGGSSSGGGASSGGGGGGNGFASSSSVTSEFKADFWEQLELGVKGLLSKDGTATVHRMAGLVTVSDQSDRIQAVRQYLDRLTAEVHGQVLIQAELVEVSLDNSFETGVDWTAVANFLGGRLTVAQTLSPNPMSGLLVSYARGSSSAVLRALEQQGKVDVLSRPRVLTLNNQKALMKVGREDVFFSTTLVPGYAGAGGAVSQPLTVSTPRTITVGIMLDVSPQIRTSGRVALHVHLSISEKFGTAVSPDQKSTAPILDVREADAVVEVDSGQTLAIGGLTQMKELDTREGLPFLSRIPIVGALFRHRLQEKRKVELVLLMTPTVMRPAQEAALLGGPGEPR